MRIPLLLLATALLAPGPEEPDRPALRLLPSCRICLGGRELDLVPFVETPSGTEIDLQRALLTLTNERGDELLAQPETLDSRVVREAVEKLPAGVYRAVLRLDGLASNVITFEIDPEARAKDLLPLDLEPAVSADGQSNGREFLAFFRNTGDERLDLARAWIASQVVLDGVEHAQKGIWFRGSDLPPGEAASFWVDLDDFLDPQSLAPGRHEIQFRCAGHLSKSLTFEVAGRR